jgi:hypothetical protein
MILTKNGMILTKNEILKAIEKRDEPIGKLNALAKTAHAIAVEKEWWKVDLTGKTILQSRPWSEVLFLTITELAEAFETFRDGHPPTEIWWDENGKPEGFPIEIADFVIRVLDLVQAKGAEIRQCNERLVSLSRIGSDLADYLLAITRKAAQGSNTDIDVALHLTMELSKKIGFDIFDAIAEKMAFNSTRPKRHGGKAA